MADCLIECCQCHAELCKGVCMCCVSVAKECDSITCNSYGDNDNKIKYKPVSKAPESLNMTRDIPLVF